MKNVYKTWLTLLKSMPVLAKFRFEIDQHSDQHYQSTHTEARPLWFHCFDEMRTYFETIISELYQVKNVKILRIARLGEKKYDSYIKKSVYYLRIPKILVNNEFFGTKFVKQGLDWNVITHYFISAFLD